jgi:hypothetical protein
LSTFIVVVLSRTHSLLTFVLHLCAWDSIALSYLVPIVSGQRAGRAEVANRMEDGVW